MSLDGHFIVTTSTKQLIVGWITFQDEDIEYKKPCLYRVLPEPVRIVKKTKSFLGIKFSGEVNFNSLCKRYSVETPNSKFAAESDEEYKEENNIVPEIHEAKSAIEQALKSVNERGDKIKTLDVKIREMSERSKGFAEMAAELANKNKNKKWWQL